MAWTKEQQKEFYKKWRLEHPNYHNKYYQKNKSKMNNYANRYHEQLRSELINIIQGSIGCSLCPINRVSQLHFHHINHNGKQDRNRFKKDNGIVDKIAWIRHMTKHYQEEKAVYPLQVLCQDCHKSIHKS